MGEVLLPTEAEPIVILQGDCLSILPRLPAGAVSAVVTDPPYHGVADCEWDNQWRTDADFLGWVAVVCGLLDPVTADNASLYWFASPHMAGRVELEIARRFRVLNSIVWDKGGSRNGVGGKGVDVGTLRRYWSAGTERVIFAEKYGADQRADDASGYTTQCEATKRTIIGEYLRAEFKRAGVTNREIAALFPSATGGLTGCVSNWLLGYNLPTREQYEAMRRFLNSRNCARDYLRREYEDLRREYEDLRREYEDLRRPFNVTARDEWGDVWRFPIERDRQHPTQKPLSMMRHIIKASSREGDLILDPFIGSGTTALACLQTGRRCLGIEISSEYVRVARRRIAAYLSSGPLFAAVEQQSLFAGEPP